MVSRNYRVCLVGSYPQGLSPTVTPAQKAAKHKTPKRSNLKEVDLK